jgi:hypothetical protein
MTSARSAHLLSPRRAAGLAAAALIAFVPAAAHAVRGYDNFNTTPMSKFSKEDSALMMAKVEQALKAEKDGETLEWKSAATLASGSVTPLARFTAEGMACRRLKVVNVYGALKNEGVYKFCEKPPGKWKLLGLDTGGG